jgi:signal transduction histidine kinase
VSRPPHAAQSAPAIAKSGSRDQLAASRARVLAAGDDARRRVVRDLHDGAQQRLVTRSWDWSSRSRRSTRNRATRRSSSRRRSVAPSGATGELRELAHGILPSLLTRGGLRAGVDAFVSRLDLLVDVDVLSERLPPDLEASACFIVAEALTNVVKHAQATRATVTAAVDDGVLTLEVRDDGVGGSNPEGHGLVGIADRGRRARRSAADRNRGRRRDGCGCLVAVVDWVAARVGR